MVLQVPISAPEKRPSYQDFYDAGFGTHILPVVPPGAALSPSSKLDPGNLGKTPGRLRLGGYVGFHGWQEHETTAADIAQWDRDAVRALLPPSIGLQGRQFPAIDIDIDDFALAESVKALALEMLGPAPARHTATVAGHVGARCALFYRSTAPLPSWTIKFKDNAGVDRAVEFKASKTQTLAEGRHKSGGWYVYPDGESLVTIGAERLTRVDADTVERFREALISAIASTGGALVSAGKGRAKQGPSTRASAPSLAAVKDALDAAPNGDDIDRTEWVKVAHNVKGACIGLTEDGFELFADWAGEEHGPFENVVSLWRGLPAEPDTGWNELMHWSMRRAGGEFELEDAEDIGPEKMALRAAEIERMFQEQVWVEHQERIFDLKDRRLRNRLQFNSHLTEVGKPSQKGKCAWDVFMNEADRLSSINKSPRRQSVVDMTYKPGCAAILEEDGVRRVNTWRAAVGLPTVPVTDADVEIWLAHVEHLVQAPAERAAFLNWMAAVLQFQDKKPNFGVVIGGRHGIGKSMLIEPLRVGFGKSNVQEILASQLEGGFSGWLGEAKLFVVEEMIAFKKKEAMQRLKSYLAAPPHTLPVNPKFGKTYTVPNLVAGIFFTNHPDAVAIEPGERRFFVIWSEAEKKSAAYFKKLADWYEGGGAALAAAWLLQRPVQLSAMTGEAPNTGARDEMRKANRTKLEEMIETAIEDRQWPLAANIVALDDVRAWVTVNFGKHAAPSASRVRAALLAGGAVPLSETTRFALGRRPEGFTCDLPDCSPKQARLFAVRDAGRYAGMSNAAVVAEYWREREEASRDAFPPEFL